MVAGNVFQLILNDGSLDTLLYGSRVLHQKLSKYVRTRMNTCIKQARIWLDDPSNLMDPSYEDRKALFLSDPDEYCYTYYADKIQPSLVDISKSHGVYINSCYKPFVKVAYTYIKSKDSQGLASFGNEIKFDIPLIGNWTSDMVLHMKLDDFAAKSPLDKVKYADFLGHRLIDQVIFYANWKEVARYSREAYNKHYYMDVPLDKRAGYLRSIGQEEIHKGFLTQVPANDEHREIKYFSDGPQTYKNVQDPVDIWLPLLFWFNKDIARAFPNGKADYLTLQVGIKLNTMESCVNVLDGGGGGEFTPPSIATMDVWSNQVATTPEIAKTIFASNYDHNLIRVTKEFSHTINAPHGDIKFQSIKYPIENYAISLRPLENENNIDIWHRNTKLIRKNIEVPVVADPITNTLGINNAYYFKSFNTIRECGLKVYDVDIYPSIPVKFFDSYIPYSSKGYVTPELPGWILFNFQQRHDLYDPSGWLNGTRSKKGIYFNYISDVVDNDNRANIYVVADCINFLSFDKNSNSIILRYGP